MAPKARMRGWSLRATLLTYLVLALVPIVYALLAVALLLVLAGGFAVVALLVYEFIYRHLVIRMALTAGMLAIVVLFAAWNIVRVAFVSLFSMKQFTPAVWINPDREPHLRQFVHEICHGVGSKPPDAIVLHTGLEFFAMQGEVSVLNATPRGRILCISLPLTAALTRGELRAVLAHEFAHFTGRDTLYSSVAFRVYRSAGVSAQGLFGMWRSGNWWGKALTAPALIPAAGLLGGYVWFFHLVNMAMSRTREFRADAIAAQFSGRRFVDTALRKTAGYSLVFPDALRAKTIEATQQREPHDSPYRLLRKSLHEQAALAAKAVQEVLDKQAASGGDTHPTVRNRLRALPDTVGVPAPDLDQPALGLLIQLKYYEAIAGDFMLNEYRIAERERHIYNPTPHLT